MARPAVDPWHSPAAIAALSARSRPLTREAWLDLLADALREHGTQGGAAGALGLSLRQLARWVAWLRANDPQGLARLPDMPVGGRTGPRPAKAPRKPAP